MDKIIPIEDVKKILVEILKYIDETCKKHNIIYFLGAGTLLGAARHKGFIPWDDDIDLFMTRENYEKFIKCSSNTKSRYITLSLTTDEKYYYPFIKVVDSNTKAVESGVDEISNLGVWVDIFCLDDFKESFIKWKIKSFYLRKFWASCKKSNKRARKWAKRVDKMAKHYSKINLGKLAIIFSSNPKDVFKREWFNEVDYLEFEGEKYPVPKDYKAVLTCRYGDYMKLPPLDQQKSNHSVIFTYKEKL